MGHRGISKVAVVVFVVACFLVLTSVAVPWLYHNQRTPWNGSHARDLEQVRGMGYAFTLYYKKYGYFPCLTDMQAKPGPVDLPTARKNGGYPACLALKLLMQGGFIEDPKMFFSPRDQSPTDATLAAMQVNLDPRQDPTWACTYAYDPGHLPTQPPAVLFGNRQSLLIDTGFATDHVLTCEMVAKEVEADANQAYVIPSRRVDGSGAANDNLYADDAATFGWTDSYLQWDVPAELP